MVAEKVQGIAFAFSTVAIGKHTHSERLVIALTDASVKISTEDGKSQSIDLKAVTAFWGGAETHSAINSARITEMVTLILSLSQLLQIDESNCKKDTSGILGEKD